MEQSKNIEELKKNLVSILGPESEIIIEPDKENLKNPSLKIIFNGEIKKELEALSFLKGKFQETGELYLPIFINNKEFKNKKFKPGNFFLKNSDSVVEDALKNENNLIVYLDHLENQFENLYGIYFDSHSEYLPYAVKQFLDECMVFFLKLKKIEITNREMVQKQFIENFKEKNLNEDLFLDNSLYIDSLIERIKLDFLYGVSKKECHKLLDFSENFFKTFDKRIRTEFIKEKGVTLFLKRNKWSVAAVILIAVMLGLLFFYFIPGKDTNPNTRNNPTQENANKPAPPVENSQKQAPEFSK